MSLILDALNRSRGEQDEVPTLGTRHDHIGHRATSGLWGLLVALVAAVLLIAWLLWDRAARPGAEVVVSPPLAAQDSQDSRPPEPPSLSPATATPEPITPAALPVAEPELVAEASTPPPAAEPAPDVSALYSREAGLAEQSVPAAEQPSKPVAIAEPTVDDNGVDIERLVLQAEDELENARLAEHPAPFIAALSQQTKDAIPSILYARHDYSGRPGQSVVVLNGQDLKAGGSPASGVKVVEILPDSVVLDYRGTQFRLRALNSWVNL